MLSVENTYELRALVIRTKRNLVKWNEEQSELYVEAYKTTDTRTSTQMT